MTSLRPNLVKRIERLPKPTNVASAMQPLFEAVSNSIHSTQARFGDDVSEKGRVTVTVNTSRNKNEVWATVEDNGNGLNEKNWDAFTTTDTDNKIEIGGKGVGRLMWLDCFESIRVKSTYTNDGSALRRKSFDFVLALDNQIRNLSDEAIGEEVDVGFFVRFTGLRNNAYRDKFPGRDSFIFQHFTSHFLPSFIGGRSPRIQVIVGSESRDYPDAISEIVHRQDDAIDLDTAEYGVLTLTLMECSKVASSDLKGKHFVHFIAHDRTVHSQCIDGKLGLNYFGENSDRVFHAIVTGQFLDSNVNQERTAFTFEDAVIERIINDVCSPEIEVFLEGPISELRGQQREKIEQITATYPSVAFGAMEELQQRVPSGELKEDAIYGHLARERFRRDERQAEKIRHVLTRLKDTSVEVDDFFDAIRDAGSAIEEAEQKSLAEYVVRRKVVLDFIEILLEKVRADTKDSSYQREDVLHSFICPIRVETLTEGGSQFSAASSHDLWIVDERLTFAQYFSSDVEFSKISETMDSDERADVLVFDYVHGLRQTEEPSKVLLVEFKRPGRTSYNADENPQFQIERYVKQLQSGNLTDIKGRPIKLDGNTIFYCFIVADIVGKMDDWSYSWQRTANGRGRVYRPDSGFRGSIELISWDDLITDARNRNQAFFDKAGISGQSFFSSE
ncbi:ATP-binding protein [Hyphomonas sp. UBA1923]|uniref:ATP-binding protein n=3 Tax=Hyphomonas TaxID=85 RepID=UPI0025BA8679|nr:ATP-binding protein [Hyphomonas sp. UBA1923]